MVCGLYTARPPARPPGGVISILVQVILAQTTPFERVTVLFLFGHIAIALPQCHHDW